MRSGSFGTKWRRERSNEEIEEADTRSDSSFLHVLCECGLEDCARVLAITRPVYERVRSDPRQCVITPSHLIPEVEDVVEESDGFLIVAKRGGTPEAVAAARTPGARLQPTNSELDDRAAVPQIVGGYEPDGVREWRSARVEFEQDDPCEAPIMQVPDLIWSELVSYGADLFEAGGCDERQPFRDRDTGHAMTVCLSAPRLHRYGGGQSRRAMVLLERA